MLAELLTELDVWVRGLQQTTRSGPRPSKSTEFGVDDTARKQAMHIFAYLHLQ